LLLQYLHKHEYEAGCDEAGRGCIAGPVCAAAVILPHDFFHPLLNDSKQLSEENRYLLRPVIEKHAIAFSVAFVDHLQIDKINILQASFLAMHKAIGKLDRKPTFLLIDGNRFKAYADIPHACIIKGDGKYQSIAAASILAKTKRDEIMDSLHELYPEYNWKQNKGYPTIEHRLAIEKHGPSPHHRMTFRLLADKSQLELFD
jgi:ribonuclease HII